MRHLAWVLIVPAACLGLGGCATRQVAPPATVANVDSSHIAAVERQAALNGIKVVWVNPPAKRPAVPGS